VCYVIQDQVLLSPLNPWYQVFMFATIADCLNETTGCQAVQRTCLLVGSSDPFGMIYSCYYLDNLVEGIGSTNFKTYSEVIDFTLLPRLKNTTICNETLTGGPVRMVRTCRNQTFYDQTVYLVCEYTTIIPEGSNGTW
jgi:hypothetical protein